MIFVSYTKTDTYYEFVGEDGQKLIYPVNTIILTDDESGFIAVKNTASRQTIGLIAKPKPKVRHIIYDAETATKGYPAILTHGYGGASSGRFNNVEGTYFNTIPMEVYELLCTNNIPLMVEFSQVNETNTLGKVMTGWWSPTYYENLPISTEEPLAIYLTPAMLDSLNKDLVLLNGFETTQDIIVTKVYYEV